jgi:Tol biopolymer transport system component
VSHGNLTNNPANDGWARWSPDGQEIVFHSNRDGNFEIYVMNADGSGTRRLTQYPGVDMFPDWSPDGQEIVFRRDQDIYVMNAADGTGTRQLTHDSPQFAQMAAWSPNGQYLAFMSFREGYCSVFRMNADGTQQTNLTPKNPTDPGRRTVRRSCSCPSAPAPVATTRSSAWMRTVATSDH